MEVKVYFESKNYAELAATFYDENVYHACCKALEKEALESNFERVTESFSKGMSEDFPNGFDKWSEAHFEIVSFIIHERSKKEPNGKIKEIVDRNGVDSFWKLADKWTNEFENLHIGETWEDINWWEELDDFLLLKNRGKKKAIVEPEKTYYLFGAEVAHEYRKRQIKGVLDTIEEFEIKYGTFCFIEGVTKSAEFAAELNGFMEYIIISEDDFNKLEKL